MKETRHIEANSGPSPNVPDAAGGTTTHAEAAWLIYFDDPDIKPELFTDEAVARARYEACLMNWTCHLFAPAAVLAQAGIKIAGLRGAIAMALNFDHYPGCRCSQILRNECNERRLREVMEGTK